ncbi:MAG: hypothetical protein ACREYC_14165 [Gammaproteobacteria bacterium]
MRIVRAKGSSSAMVLSTIASRLSIGDALLPKGRPIPENDIWIAAVAAQHGLTGITR